MRSSMFLWLPVELELGKRLATAVGTFLGCCIMLLLQMLAVVKVRGGRPGARPQGDDVQFASACFTSVCI